MRPFNWEQLLKDQRVPYIESGANVKRGELAIQCPFCGSADPSKHLGLNLETGWWSCWRNRAQHSGKSPLRLIMKLLSVPYGRAREIAGLGDDYIDPEGFDAVAARLMGRNKTEGRPEQTQRRALRLEESFLDISTRIRTRKYWNYLYTRGFNSSATSREDDVDALCRQYNLKAGQGAWTDRIIVPYYQDGKLVTWTGRAISQATIRYKDLDLESSLMAPKETLFNHDAMLEGGKTLVLVEGPFDALKLDFYGARYGVRAVALSTNSIKSEQAFLLQTAIAKFDQVIVMLDNATALGIIDSVRMKAALSFLPDVKIAGVPYGAKDAGDLTPAQVRLWSQTITQTW